MRDIAGELGTCRLIDSFKRRITIYVVLAVEFAAVLLFCGLEIRGESFLLIPAALVSGMLGGVIASNVR